MSAKDIIPSNMITLAPYTFFCIKRKRGKKSSKQKIVKAASRAVSSAFTRLKLQNVTMRNTALK